MNHYFDAVLVINLARRRDRWEALTRELQRGGWPFRPPQRIEAVDGLAADRRGSSLPAGAWGALRSHALALDYADRCRARRVLILEDDCVLCPDFAARVFGFLAAVPADWNCLMLGDDARQGRPAAVVPGVDFAHPDKSESFFLADTEAR